MKGYIQSKMTTWMHIFKMSIRPGGKIPLEELYKMYGEKHGIDEKDFVPWLKDVKLKGKLQYWTIVEQDSDYVAEDAAARAADNANIKKNFETNTKGEIVAKRMSVEDVVNLPVRKARDIIPTIMDVNLLKYALVEAKPRPNKESLIRILEKRVNELGQHL